MMIKQNDTMNPVDKTADKLTIFVNNQPESIDFLASVLYNLSIIVLILNWYLRFSVGESK